ncbi:MAG: polymerase protein [Candidatus Collierbacteria bacterium GW2011_GWB1_45_35]|uniref:Polymerase protein n=2 Tax=Candidatus Collieribacteriota TaxID=1752725 RepID=A0A0G1KT79_9BACT|nr:MAG: polymerase protein [Microgenomates group bacterium GW2011_GWC1_44_23]KKT86783.1 MAG: polymerase protein [Candidatus Collierbacteria bacterium GW2011_GWA2_44_99]KKT95592.1 MAG: polymerase protein [Candidatus Collierbacteria bacterium GW2011_GWA1_45_15]KKU00508.1 MAG: polymerase protein [Candidatus Collierbacteria bacterium GW2011_GWB2_45_17]KKU05608.1 MAG: polymerase protein [Candidatus Collierbacteria bacterium GW2011_GWB1_45_35]KKU08221.1 MAG: polymerase protein [Candidatus Collierbac
MRKLILIDGNALLHRAYHAYPPLSTPKGELVNAVYGFSSMLLSVLEKLSPTHVAVAWDLKGPTFRKQEFEAYKANRDPMDEDLATQIDRTKEVVEKLNIPQYGIEGFEADDIIGTISRLAFERTQELKNSRTQDEDTQVVIVTGDRDSLQLIKGKKVVVYLPIQNHHGQSVVFDEDKVREVYGLNPKQIIDLKSLMGDASDNIPGVKGVGRVTATKLIQEFGNLENIYKNINDIKITPRVKAMLSSDKEMAEKSFHLAEINCDVQLKLDWDDCLLTNYDKNGALSLFEELNFKSLISKLPKDSWEKEIQDIFI